MHEICICPRCDQTVTSAKIKIWGLIFADLGVFLRVILRVILRVKKRLVRLIFADLGVFLRVILRVILRVKKRLVRSDKLLYRFACPDRYFTCPGRSDSVNVEPWVSSNKFKILEKFLMLMYYISSAATGVWMRQGLTLLPGCSGSAASGLVKKYRIDGGKIWRTWRKKRY